MTLYRFRFKVINLACRTIMNPLSCFAYSQTKINIFAGIKESFVKSANACKLLASHGHTASCNKWKVTSFIDSRMICRKLIVIDTVNFRIRTTDNSCLLYPIGPRNKSANYRLIRLIRLLSDISIMMSTNSDHNCVDSFRNTTNSPVANSAPRLHPFANPRFSGKLITRILLLSSFRYSEVLSFEVHY